MTMEWKRKVEEKPRKYRILKSEIILRQNCSEKSQRIDFGLELNQKAFLKKEAYLYFSKKFLEKTYANICIYNVSSSTVHFTLLHFIS